MGASAGDETDPAPWRRTAAQVIVRDLDDATLDDDALHHLARVLRLRSGTTLCATDGAGGWRPATFTGAATLEPEGPIRTVGAPTPTLSVGFVPVKGERPELVVQKLTELGVDRIVAFSSQRSVVRWDRDRADKQLARWRRIAAEACCQCRRLHLPEVVGDPEGGILTMPQLARSAGVGAGATGTTVVADAGGRPLRDEHTTVLVGPEGGWAPGETDGLETVSLGDHVLRAETAAITAGALLTAGRARLVALRAGPDGGT